MKCLKIPHRYSIYSFVLFVSLLFTFCFFSSSSFAVSDWSANINAGYYGRLCGSYSVYADGFRYLTISSVSSDTTLTYFYLTYQDSNGFHGPYNYSNLGLSSSVTYTIGSDILDFTGFQPGSAVVVTCSENPPVSGSAPSGSISITENGSYDVTSYAEAVVDVPEHVIQGDYHDDLLTINHSIIICAGVCLVLYFFYAIYRMIIRGSHGN